MNLCKLSLVGLVCFLVNFAEPCAYVRTPNGIKIVVLGPNSGAADDDVSVATCPDNYSLQECYSSVPLKSDGISPSLDASSGKIKCEVTNQHGNPAGIQAVAVCVQGDYSAQNVAVKSGDSYETNPKAQCPQGYKIETCEIYNIWSQDGCYMPKIDDQGTSCTSATTCLPSPNGCISFATCRPILECPLAV